MSFSLKLGTVLKFSFSVLFLSNTLASTPMVMEWKIPERPAKSSALPIPLESAPWGILALPMVEGYAYNFEVDWGDGSPKVQIDAFDDPDRLHLYAKSGRYTVTLSGTFEALQGICLQNGQAQLLNVEDLGQTGLTSLRGAFAHCDRLASVKVSDGDYLANVTDMSFMFSTTTLANPETGNWNTSSVTSMNSMFYGAIAANPDVSGWETSSVTDMGSMFYGALSAEPDVSQWKTLSVTNMERLFYFINIDADPDVSKWVTSSVTNMAGMFAYTSSANPDVSNWDTSLVTDMAGMFAFTVSADPDVSNWDTSAVTDMTAMFAYSLSANPDVGSWRLPSLEKAPGIFYKAISADPDISDWDAPLLKNSAGLFKRKPKL